MKVELYYRELSFFTYEYKITTKFVAHARG